MERRGICDKRRLNGGTEKICSKMRMAEARRQPPRKGKTLKNPTTFRSFLSLSLFFLSLLLSSLACAAGGLRSY
jgi:hypothetical protein